MTRWVVVGAGSAGAVVAARLAEDPANEVVLLDAGSDDPPHTGSDFFAALDAPGRTFEGLVAERVAGRPPRPYLRGRGLGGSGSVNAMIALPGGPFVAPHLLPTEPADPDELGAVDRALLAAAPDAAPVPLTRRGGHRVTVADAYVTPARARGDLVVRTEALVDRVVLDRRRAVGVLLADGTHVPADRVVVSAGAVHSPAILLRSRVDVAGVGVGLQDHPAAPLTLALHPEAVAPPGSLATAALLVRDDLQFLPLDHLGADAPRFGMLLAALMRVRSAGSVTLVDDDPRTHPRVAFDMLGDPHDLTRLVAGVRQAVDLLRHPAFDAITEAVYVDEYGTTVDHLDDDERIAGWLRDHVGGYVHAASSCRMGTVVDADCRVIGHAGLYVCDASVFPTVPEVNTHLPTVMLAETMAARWRSER